MYPSWLKVSRSAVSGKSSCKPYVSLEAPAALFRVSVLQALNCGWSIVKVMKQKDGPQAFPTLAQHVAHWSAQRSVLDAKKPIVLITRESASITAVFLEVIHPVSENPQALVTLGRYVVAPSFSGGERYTLVPTRQEYSRLERQFIHTWVVPESLEPLIRREARKAPFRGVVGALALATARFNAKRGDHLWTLFRELGEFAGQFERQEHRAPQNISFGDDDAWPHQLRLGSEG